ncbi:MAG TPA: cytochrome c oxidase subunit 3 [Acidiferrobacter sp.]|nr:cytochrome c oxidase subunit 3 [Acidiferrobacter sp.]
MSTSASKAVDIKTDTLWCPTGHSHDGIATKTLGFWLYMLSDAMIFTTLFAAYMVLSHAFNAAGGPTITDVAHPVYAYGETALIFSSVLSYGFAMMALKRGSRKGVIVGISIALLLGIAFLCADGHETALLFSQGADPERSGFLSAFFSLVFYHGLHVVVGVFWMLVMIVQVASMGFTDKVVYRLLNLRLFWHFQAVIWVFMYTFLYLRGLIA